MMSQPNFLSFLPPDLLVQQEKEKRRRQRKKHDISKKITQFPKN